MTIALGVALIAAGIVMFAVGRGQQDQMDASMAAKAKKWPQSKEYKPGEISGLYLKMKSSFSKGEKTVKLLKQLAIFCIVAGAALVGIGLATR